MPKFRPWVKNSTIATIESAAEIGKRDAAKAREIEMRIVRHDPQRRQQVEHADHGQHGNQNAKRDENELSHSGSDSQIGTVFGRFHRTHQATIRRVSVKAVNTVVMMPMPSVTAKPRTGPVPI